ncbi:MAG: LysR family transcriptional regulator [Andreesenia angusta]|nr:LysR family transcriptional regulator [Andreesenia angusta]
MKISGRIWLENDDKEKLFGIGICDLLKGVGKYGSLSEAAKQMGMSYNKAHNLVKIMEKRLGFSVITTQIGGVRGGGSTLTEKGFSMIERYDKLMEKLNKDMEEGFNLYFSDLDKEREIE